MAFQTESDWRSDASIAYALMRLTFGVNLLMRGLMRIYTGTVGFEQGMLKQFENTPMPAAIIQPFALALPWVESAIGLLLILGLQTRIALIAGSLMMTALTFGTMVRQDFQIAFLQLGYVLIFFVLLALRPWNRLSIDARLEPPLRAEVGERTR
ncbi:MAG: MauE/DoxX family redox-associated membrane protein [Acidobacteriota bacterium]